MLKFHPYSILTGDTMVGFVIFCVLSSKEVFEAKLDVILLVAINGTLLRKVDGSSSFCQGPRTSKV